MPATDKKRTNPAFSSHFPITPAAIGAKIGIWHMFPIDNPATCARIGIIGARALGFFPS
jgi:hypothetical protein